MSRSANALLCLVLASLCSLRLAQILRFPLGRGLSFLCPAFTNKLYKPPMRNAFCSTSTPWQTSSIISKMKASSSYTLVMEVESTDAHDTEVVVRFDNHDDNPGSDFIIMSNDGVKFYVHKHILILASGAFKDMFADARPNTPSEDPLPENAVTLTESAEVIDALLRACYPAIPPITGFDFALEVLVATRKYRMPAIQEQIESRLRHLIVGGPLYMWGRACAHVTDNDVEKDITWDIAMLAARTWKKITRCNPQRPRVENINGVTSLAYRRLLVYGQAALHTTPTPTDFRAAPAKAPPPTPWPSDGLNAKRFHEYTFPRRTNLHVESLDGVVFHANYDAVQERSAIMEDIAPTRRSDGHHCLKLPHDTWTTWLIIYLCYAIIVEEKGVLDYSEVVQYAPSTSICAMYHAAKEYGLWYHFTQGELYAFLKHPHAALCIYFLAVKDGRGSLARDAAVAWVRRQQKTKWADPRVPGENVPEEVLR